MIIIMMMIMIVTISGDYRLPILAPCGTKRAPPFHTQELPQKQLAMSDADLKSACSHHIPNTGSSVTDCLFPSLPSWILAFPDRHALESAYLHDLLYTTAIHHL